VHCTVTVVSLKQQGTDTQRNTPIPISILIIQSILVHYFFQVLKLLWRDVITGDFDMLVKGINMKQNAAWFF